MSKESEEHFSLQCLWDHSQRVTLSLKDWAHLSHCDACFAKLRACVESETIEQAEQRLKDEKP